MRRHFLFLFALCILAQFTWAVNQSYYNSIANTKEATLRDNLTTITSAGPSGMSYTKLWTAYKTTDVYPTGHASAGKIWDMYAGCAFTYSNDQCGNYSGICDCYNREHSLPASWFSDDTPMYYDLGHIVPTDGQVNNYRSNYPFGEVDGGTTYTGGSKRGSAKSVTTSNTIVNSGSTTQSCASSLVFEPIDEYKGDFARMYMYMRVRYKSTNFTQDGTYGKYHFQTLYTKDGYYGFTAYSVALLMKWHRQDPVSQKEIDRNNGMESVQGNRNPFIDYPALAEYLWGRKSDATFSFNDVVGSFESDFEPGVSDGFKNNTDPAITSPNGTIDFGSTNTTTPVQIDVTVKGINLTSGNLTLGISGTNSAFFALATTTVTKAQAEAGYNVTITYAPTANGSHTATLTISGCGVTSHTVTLTGTCETSYTATWMANGSEHAQTTAASGQSPDVPTTNPSDCSGTDGKKFVGWTELTSILNGARPYDLFTTTAPAIYGNKTFNAVYATATAGSGGSGTASFVPSNFSGQGVTGTGGPISATVDGVTFSCDKGFGTTQIRCYSGGSITISSSYTITAIAFTFSGSSYKGGLDDSYTNLSTNSWTQTLEGQARFTKIEVTYSGGSSTEYSDYALECSSTPKVTITFDANGGDGTMADQQITQNTTGKLNPNIYTRTHYTFLGWNTNQNATTATYADEANISVGTSNITLYAIWDEDPKYTVTFKNNGVICATRTGYEGTIITDPDNPTPCDGYTFYGWTSVAISTHSEYGPIEDYNHRILEKDTTFHAVFTKSVTTGGSGGTESNDYELYSGTLTEGDYVIYYTTNSVALKNTVSSSRLGYADLTVTNNVISSPDASIVWHIAANGNYWTIYNSDVAKYAGGTTTRNQGALLDDVTDYALWTCTSTNTSTTYDFENKGRAGNTSYPNNKYLRNNLNNTTNYGFACYSNSTGGALTLYKKNSSGSGSTTTTYYTTSPDCTPCTATITIVADPAVGGTVSFVEP